MSDVIKIWFQEVEQRTITTHKIEASNKMNVRTTKKAESNQKKKN